MTPAAAVAQGLDPAALEAELEAVAGTGGMPAPASEPVVEPDTAVPGPQTLAEPDTAPTPTSAPEPGPAAEPGAEILSETAPAPAPESVPEPNAVPTTAPTNINVDIRILSPGDNGDVSQEIEMPVDPALPPQIDAPDLAPIESGTGSGGDWNWIWNWEAACESDVRASVADWNWIWEWGSDCAGGPGTLDLRIPELPAMPGLGFSDDRFPEMPAGFPFGTGESAGESHVVTESDVVLSLGEPSRASRDRPQGGGAPATARGATEPAAGYPAAPLGAGTPAELAPRAASHAASGRAEHDDSRQDAEAQTPLPAIPALAASASSSAGSTAPLAAALLAMLCLLAPRALELAHPRFTQLSSLLSSSRLERPG